MGDRIRSFRDLRVYQEAFRLQQEVFEVSKGFPKEELYSLTDQIRLPDLWVLIWLRRGRKDLIKRIF